MEDRVIAYVDGFNLYHGLRSKNWKRYYWLNVHQLALRLTKPHQRLLQVKYFTSVIKHPDRKRLRQAVFLEALRTLDDFRIIYGHFLFETVRCRNCGFEHRTYHEKMTDVNIAVELLTDASSDCFDTALLLTADSDLVAAVRAVRNLSPRKRVVVVFPPARSSYALKQAADGYSHISRVHLAKSLFSKTVLKQDGYLLRRPAAWS